MTYEEREKIAEHMYMQGEKPRFSTGICGSLTAGYGELDGMGYWEYPLPLYISNILVQYHDL